MCLLRIAAVLSVALQAARLGAAPDEIELSPQPSGAIKAPVSVNGRGGFGFLLDTGSSHSTLSRELADRLALPLIAKARVLTPAGVQVQPVVRLERIAIGNACVEGLMPSVVSLAELSQLEPGVDGVIGQDFLSAFDYTIDYRRKRLLWTAEAADEHLRLPLIRVGNRSLVRLPSVGGGAPILMVPDSGSEAFVLFERNGRTALDVDAYTFASVSALGMRRAGRAAILRRLQIGEVTLRNQPAVVVARDASSTVEPDGLMPLHPFGSVSFNNSEGYLVVRMRR